jgi:hypothetical protein
MKKKLLAILAAFVAVTPLAAVNAEDFDYSLGHEHNFIINKTQEDAHAAGDETVGIKMVSIGEDDEDPTNYVLGIATGAFTMKNTIYDNRGAYNSSNLPSKFTDSLAWNTVVADYNGAIKDALIEQGENLEYDVIISTPYVKNFNTTESYLKVPTSAQMLSWFANTKVSDTEYTLTSQGISDFKKIYFYSLGIIGGANSVMDQMDIPNLNTYSFKGYVLGDDPEVTSTDILTWVAIPTFADGELTSVTIKQISSNTNNSEHNMWMIVPILSFNKTYNCKFDTTKKTACFKCGDDYQWLVVGEQASTCSIVSGVTSKAKCVKNPPTGVEDYILEFAIAAGICGIVLFAVKRKSLFSRV